MMDGPAGTSTGALVGGTAAEEYPGLQAANNKPDTTNIEPIKYVLFIFLSLQASNEPSIENTLWKNVLDLFKIKIELEKSLLIEAAGRHLEIYFEDPLPCRLRASSGRFDRHPDAGEVCKATR